MSHPNGTRVLFALAVAATAFVFEQPAATAQEPVTPTLREGVYVMNSNGHLVGMVIDEVAPVKADGKVFKFTGKIGRSSIRGLYEPGTLSIRFTRIGVDQTYLGAVERLDDGGIRLGGSFLVTYPSGGSPNPDGTGYKWEALYRSPIPGAGR